MLLGLDIGTTGVKAAVYDPGGGMKGYGFEEYGIICERPAQAEQDSEAVWRAAQRAMGIAVSQSGGDIEAISLSAQGDAVIPVDRDGRALAPAHLGMDYRATEETARFAEEFGGEELFRLTGMRPHPMNSLCKIRWFVKNRPALAERTHKFMTYADYILWKLGADHPVIDMPMASRSMALRIENGQWDPGLLQAAGIGPDSLSLPVSSGTVVGTLRGDLCRALGVRTGVKIVAGGHDQTCAALGAGIVEPGLALDSHGTAEVISTAFREPYTGKVFFDGFFPCYRHVLPGVFFTFSLNHTAGILLKWFVEGFCGGDRTSADKAGKTLYEYVLAQAGEPPSSLLALPYFNGSGTPECDLEAKGVIAGLTLSTTRYEVALAILEALGYDMRANLEAMAEAGIAIADLRCVGGGARSPLGLQLKADIIGIPVQTLKNREAACLGAALLAGQGIGVFPRVAEAAKSIVEVRECYQPREKPHAVFSEKYALFRALASANRKVMHSLGRLHTKFE